jgi:hypothetical protein
VRFLTIAGFVLAGGLVLFVVREGSFYFLPVAERPLHPAFALLRPSGKWGLSFGLVGTGLVFLNLGYLIRRAFLRWEWLGSLRSWMALHVFTGLVGGGLVLLHSAFAPRSPLGGMAFWSMFIVLLTGMIGRYLYTRVPRSAEGRELEMEEIRQRLAEHKNQIAALGLSLQDFEVAWGEELEGSILGTLLFGNARIRRGLKRLKEGAGTAGVSPDVVDLARRYFQDARWFARYAEFRGLMGGWRFLHRWFALLMLTAVGFHIWVALRTGNLWIVEALRP